MQLSANTINTMKVPKIVIVKYCFCKDRTMGICESGALIESATIQKAKTEANAPASAHSFPKTSSKINFATKGKTMSSGMA